jgi:hypothetical protein
VPTPSGTSGDNNSTSTGNTRVLRSMTSGRNSSSRTLASEDFKFKNVLGHRRSGKTLLCEFRGETIALKSSDLSKAKPHILKEMQKEVEIYKILADIHSKIGLLWILWRWDVLRYWYNSCWHCFK